MSYSSTITRNLILIPICFGLQMCQNSPDKQAAQSIKQETATKSDSIHHDTINVGIKYNTYCNSRFGFCVDYPVGVLFPQGESDAGDGQIFKSKDAENTMTVYWDYRDTTKLETSLLETAYNNDASGSYPDKPQKVVTYKRLGNGYYIVSGYDDGKIFYQKTISGSDKLFTCYLEYKENEKEYYAKVAERVFSSFKIGSQPL